MEDIELILENLSRSDPVTLALIVALAAIGLCAMALWVLVKLNKGRGSE